MRFITCVPLVVKLVEVSLFQINPLFPVRVKFPVPYAIDLTLALLLLKYPAVRVLPFRSSVAYRSVTVLVTPTVIASASCHVAVVAASGLPKFIGQSNVMPFVVIVLVPDLAAKIIVLPVDVTVMPVDSVMLPYTLMVGPIENDPLNPVKFTSLNDESVRPKLTMSVPAVMFTDMAVDGEVWVGVRLRVPVAPE